MGVFMQKITLPLEYISSDRFSPFCIIVINDSGKCWSLWTQSYNCTSVHIQMGKIKYEPTAFLASSNRSPFEYVKYSRNICMRKKNSFRAEKKTTSFILPHFSEMWDTIHIYISIFKPPTVSWGGKQFVRDRILSALTHVP